MTRVGLAVVAPSHPPHFPSKSDESIGILYLPWVSIFPPCAGDLGIFLIYCEAVV